jgi:hypothetical protein
MAEVSEHIVEASPSCIGTMLTCKVRHPLAMNNDKPDTREEQGAWHCCYKYQTKIKAEYLRKLSQHQTRLEYY